MTVINAGHDAHRGGKSLSANMNLLRKQKFIFKKLFILFYIFFSVKFVVVTGKWYFKIYKKSVK